MITLVTISDSDKHFESAINEYTKRLWRWLKVHTIKPSKKSSPSECIQYDTNLIIEYIHNHPDTVIILLTKEWNERSTSQRSSCIQEYINQSRSILYIIWWPYGLDEDKLRSYVHHQLSFWKITMPHGLVKLVLLEQLYRCQQIREGRPYHY